jgi:predicted metal-dependent HD superfamily phosphohydrolase
MSPTDRVEPLRQGWGKLLDRYKVPPADGGPVLDVLVAAYSAPDRYYHNLDHLDEMFRAVGRLTTITDDVSPLHLAIWFHDAVYDSRAKDNEARSAALAETLLGPIGVPQSALDRVRQLVLATAHMTDTRPPGDRETAVLLDADLAILGSSEDRFRRYAADIRREYSWVPDAEYRKGRAQVLEQFLNRPRIFWTDVMHQEAERPARANIQAELGRLTSGTT